MERSMNNANLNAIASKIPSILLGGFVFLSLAAFSPAKASASEATGGQPGQFLSWGAGARSLAMGSAFFSISDDASATYWNPAGLTQMDRKEVMALHVNLFAETSYDFI